jgi:hypothetical protein
MTEETVVETVTLRPSAPAFSHDGAVAFGVQSMLHTPPRMLLMAHVGGADLEPQWLALGDTVEFGDVTWRFEDVHFANPDAWVATVRSVPPGAEPFTPPPLTGDRDWKTVKLRPAGQVDEATVDALEQRLGHDLPPGYRRWLAGNNGATPLGPVHVPGFRFQLSQARPLLGIHPDEPHLDLGLGLQRAPAWLTRDHVVIAVATGGLLAVRTDLPGLDEVVFLNEFTAGRDGGDLEVVAPDIYSFCAYLQPAPPVRPARLGEPDPVPAASAEDTAPEPVELIGAAIEFATRARTTMCFEFNVRYIAEVAMMARLGDLGRQGQCRDGLRYDIHGNGYDVFAPDGTPLTLQAKGYAPADRRAGPNDGLADVIDVYALRDYLDDRTGTRYDLDAITAACEEHVRLGTLLPSGRGGTGTVYELPPVPGEGLPTVPGGVEEQQ